MHALNIYVPHEVKNLRALAKKWNRTWESLGYFQPFRGGAFYISRFYRCTCVTGGRLLRGGGVYISRFFWCLVLQEGGFFVEAGSIYHVFIGVLCYRRAAFSWRRGLYITFLLVSCVSGGRLLRGGGVYISRFYWCLVLQEGGFFVEAGSISCFYWCTCVTGGRLFRGGGVSIMFYRCSCVTGGRILREAGSIYYVFIGVLVFQEGGFFVRRGLYITFLSVYLCFRRADSSWGGVYISRLYRCTCVSGGRILRGGGVYISHFYWCTCVSGGRLLRGGGRSGRRDTL